MSRTPEETIQEMYAAFARRDAATVVQLLAPDVEMVQSDELPWGGTYRGHEGARQFFGKLLHYLNSSVTIERVVRAGDNVVLIGWTEGTANPTGAKFRVAIAHVWEVRDGLARRVHFYIDHPVMLEALQDRAARL